GLAAQIRADAENLGPVGFTGRPITRVSFNVAPETPELSIGFNEAPMVHVAAPVVAQVEETPYPFSDSLLALPKNAAQTASLTVQANLPEPIETARRAQNGRCDVTFAIPAVGAVTRMQPLALTNAPKAKAARAGVAGDVQ